MSSSALRPAAASEVFRSVAHELRQPLSNIESIAYYLTLVAPADQPKFQEHLVRIRDLVEQSNWILSSGLRLAYPAELLPQALDLSSLLADTVSSQPASVQHLFRLELASELPPVHMDPRLGRALIESLLILLRHFATEQDPVVIRGAARAESGASLEMTCRAKGYRSESALGPGAALCLESARQIAETHGGSLECSVDLDAGISARVVLV